MLKILGKSSSINVRKVLWTCTQLNLEIQHEEWGSGYQNTQTPAFKTLNPNALVPVMIDDDFVLWESNTICRYLAKKYQTHQIIFPQTIHEQAKVEQWMDWQATELNTAWRYAFMALVRQSPLHSDTSLISQSIEQWQHKMTLIEQHLANHEYMAGNTFTLADIVIALSINRWKMTPIKHIYMPAINDYMQRLEPKKGFVTYCQNGIP